MVSRRVYLVLLALCIPSVLVPLETSQRPTTEPELSKSTCTDWRGEVEIRTSTTKGKFGCFAFNYFQGRSFFQASGMDNGGRDDQLTLLFPGEVGEFNCHSKSHKVLVEYVAGMKQWSAREYRGWAFGDCTLRTLEIGRSKWSGTLKGRLVMIKGDAEGFSPSKLHTVKDNTGKPIELSIEFEGSIKRPN